MQPKKAMSTRIHFREQATQGIYQGLITFFDNQLK